MQTAVRYPNNFLPGNNSAPRRGSQALGWNQAMSVMSACQYVSLVSEWPMPPNQTSKHPSGVAPPHLGVGRKHSAGTGRCQ